MTQPQPNRTFGPRERDWEHNACLGYTGFDIQMITEGFYNAANLLADRAQENDAFLDDLIYPIAYTFRQAIELKLKTCLILAHRLYATNGVQPHGHDLDTLWRDLRPWVERRFASEPDYPQIPAIEEILADFVTVDPGSFSFRYATDTQGNPMLVNLPNINVAQLQERATRLHNLLDTIEGALDIDPN